MIGPDVMLASRVGGTPEQIIAAHAGWSFELKFDGIRAVVHRPGTGAVRIFNRRRTDITYRYPDVAEAMARFTGTIDGEIVVADPGGRPNFPLAHLRDAQKSTRGVREAMAKAPATFVPFDVLWAGDDDVRALPWRARRQVLESMFAPEPGAAPVAVSLASANAAVMWQFVLDRDLEGLVAKRPESLYLPGRQLGWVKIKANKLLTALVCAVLPGKGSRAVVGALSMCLKDADGAWVGIGNVGVGFAEADLRRISAAVAAGTVMVITVEYLEVSRTGQLRMPVFKGFRTDRGPEVCTLAQLRGPGAG
jgi:bifunctional non-homologous end joining protein LigD